jgi:hypothetical protein
VQPDGGSLAAVVVRKVVGSERPDLPEKVRRRLI